MPRMSAIDACCGDVYTPDAAPPINAAVRKIGSEVETPSPIVATPHANSQPISSERRPIRSDK